MNSKIILLIAVFAFGLLMEMPIGVSAQTQTVTEIKPPNAGVLKVPPGAVVLGPGTHSENIRALTVKRQFDVNQLRSNPVITLGKTKVNLASVFKNPSALPNIATRLRAAPQLAEAVNDRTEVVEVQQGLILHHFLSYRIKPGVCTDQTRRLALSSSGVHCAGRVSDDERLASFSTRGDPHYVADPIKRAVTITEAKKGSAATQQGIASDLKKLRTSLNNPADRTKIDGQRGTGESARLAKLTDDALEAKVANSGVNKIEQVIFVPTLDKLDRLPNDKPISTFAGGSQLPPAAVDKPLAQKIFLTGFTLGRDYEWSQRVSVTIDWCLISCERTYYAEAYAGFSYGFGLRFPIKLDGIYHYKRAGGKDAASVTTKFAPINGSADQYAKTGLASDKIFDGKELVAQFEAHVGFRYDLPIIPNYDTGPIPVLGTDFTKGLPAPLTNGQFTPPAPGTTLPGAPIIFSDFDLLGGRANFGIVGAQVFPAVNVGLHSDSLSFTLRDNILKKDYPLNKSGQETELQTDPKDHSSSFTISDPVYNLGFVVTPGIDARLFVDVAVWSHNWDFPVWFPQLAIELPPGGMNFSCHDGTFCSVKYGFTPGADSKDTNGKTGDTSHQKEPPVNDTLGSNGVLLRGAKPLYSHSRSFMLSLQGDGNLVLYDLRNGGQRPLWNTHTNGNGDVKNLVMQGDCNLVLYGNSGKAIWNSHTSRGSQFCTLVVQDDGNLVIYDGAHRAVWNTGTQQ